MYNPEALATDMNSEKMNFLMICLQQNMIHARHVESERLTFISLFLASLGMIINAVSRFDNLVAIFMCVILIFVNVICTMLLKRWNEIFVGHYNAAKSIIKTMDIYLYNAKPQSESYDINNFYFFDNPGFKAQEAFNAQSTPAAAKAAAEKAKARYVRTSFMFRAVNIMTYLIVAAILFDLVFVQALGIFVSSGVVS